MLLIIKILAKIDLHLGITELIHIVHFEYTIRHYNCEEIITVVYSKRNICMS